MWCCPNNLLTHRGMSFVIIIPPGGFLHSRPALPHHCFSVALTATRYRPSYYSALKSVLRSGRLLGAVRSCRELVLFVLSVAVSKNWKVVHIKGSFFTSYVAPIGQNLRVTTQVEVHAVHFWPVSQ